MCPVVYLSVSPFIQQLHAILVGLTLTECAYMYLQFKWLDQIFHLAEYESVLTENFVQLQMYCVCGLSQ